jgi:hypothetical protein
MFVVDPTKPTTFVGSCSRPIGAEHAGRAAHVELHPLHTLRRLDGDAAGVEAEPFADETDGLRIARSAPVLEHDELRIFLRRALRDAEERSHLFALHLRASEHRDCHAIALADLSRGIGEVVGRADVAGQHPETPRERVPFADGDPRFDAALRIGRAREDYGFFHRIPAIVRGRWSFQLFKVPRAGDEPHRGGLGLRLGEVGGEESKPYDPELHCLARRERGRAPERCHPILGLAHPDQQQPLDPCRGGREVQQLVATTAELAPLERAPENPARSAVERIQRIVNHAVRRQCEHDQRNVERSKIHGARRKGEAHGAG